MTSATARRRRWRTIGRGIVLAVVFASATAVMLRPWPQKIREGMPQNLGDSVLITWIMHWGGHALTTDPRGYFHGNIFWPAGDTLAYSDLLLPFVPVYGLFFALTGNWPLSTNLTVVVMFLLCLASTYLLARRLAMSAVASVLAALAFTFTGFSLSEWGHLQLHTMGLLPLAAYFAVRFVDERSWWTAAATGVASAATMLASVYYGLLWFLCLGVFVGGHLLAQRPRPKPRLLAGSLLIGVVSLVLLAPALYKYAGQAETRGYEEDRGLKARDLVTPAFGSYLWRTHFTFDDIPASQEHGLYPGVTVVLLGAVGVATAARRPATETTDAATPPRRLHLALFGVGGVIGLVLAVGPTALGVPMPFRLFHGYVPGFSGIRVYTRLAVMFLLVLALCAGIGLQRLLARTGRTWVRVSATVVVCAAVLVDLAAPLPYWPFPDDGATLAVYHRLDDLPRAPVLQIPMVDAGIHPTPWALVEAPRMVHSTIDFHPRVNGYSARAREGYWEDLVVFNGFPAEPSLRRAEQLGVRYVVIHVGDTTDLSTLSEDDAKARLADLPAGVAVERHGRAWLVDLGRRSIP